ncbi:MAG: PTS sugar transporter subunit IIA [Pseudomonadales bacterium]|jgi:PTS system nitrogen regulatory IIA component
MTDICALLSPERTRIAVDARSRKRALELAAELIAAGDPSLSASTVFENLMTRERLGSTGLGEGIAIPHCRVDGAKPAAALLRLAAPVDFNSIDDAAVDLIFVLVVPTAETQAHLTTLAALARVFQDANNRSVLREQSSDRAFYDTFRTLVTANSA